MNAFLATIVAAWPILVALAALLTLAGVMDWMFSDHDV